MTDLARRVISSISWNLLANFIRAGVLAVRLVVLARWLPVEIFGVYGLASAIISLSLVFPGFGLGGAFLHRSQETEDESRAVDTFFTLQFILLAAWALLVTTGTLVFATGQLRTALICLILLMGSLALTGPARYILIRRVVHKRLAFIQVLSALVGTVAALTVAYAGASLWALLATDLGTLAANVLLLYLWRPSRLPRFRWHPRTVRYYLSFGWRNLLANLTESALDRVDSLWIGLYLGEAPLGFYSRAYALATYPRRMIMDPARNVLRGAYAELKTNRRGLSRAVFGSNAVLIRMSFLGGGLLFVVAEEFIGLLLTEKWLPMLDAFRILLLYALLDPSRRALADLFVAVGKPQELIRSRGFQLLMLTGTILVLGPTMGIAGVAVAVDLGLLVGLSVMVRSAREYIDFSLMQLLWVPTLGLLIGIGITLMLESQLLPTLEAWQIGLIKSGVFSTLYCGLLAGLEYRKLLEIATYLTQFGHHSVRGKPRIQDDEV
jgi:PST family polysaccharide transporter